MDDDDADVDVFGRGEDCGVTLFVGVLSGVCLRFERRPIFRPRRTRDVMSASTLRLCAKRRQFLRVCCRLRRGGARAKFAIRRTKVPQTE